MEKSSHLKVWPNRFRSEVGGKKTNLYRLVNKTGMEIAVTNFGARVVELYVPDRTGVFADVVLGHDCIEKYVNYSGERFLGSVIGRYGNRIANGKFVLDGREYSLPLNNAPNSLHGGFNGFDMKVWDVNQMGEQHLHFVYHSADGEEGYPGKLRVNLLYRLTDRNEFIICYWAETNKPTVVNLTHHSFFNLHGEGNGTILDHQLEIFADEFTPVDQYMIPDGRIIPVENTPLDFRTPKFIGERINEDDVQLKYGNGYDHNWVLSRGQEDSLKRAAMVYDPQSGRTLEVYTTAPGMQFYSGNFFDGKVVGKSGKPYLPRASFALETQHFPDSPNRPEFPSTVLHPGEEYRHICVYKFGVR